MFAQVAPQVIPAGLEETEPVPVPVLDTVSVERLQGELAVTDFAASTVTTHVPVPEHPAPDHPVKFEPVAGVAVNVTTVPFVYELAQVAPQLIPAGLDVTVPLPFPSWTRRHPSRPARSSRSRIAAGSS